MTCQQTYDYFKILYMIELEKEKLSIDYDEKGKDEAWCEYLGMVGNPENVPVFECKVRDTCLPPSAVEKCKKHFRECPYRLTELETANIKYKW